MWWKALLALVVAVAMIIGVNYANDYSDGIRGTDDARAGPLRLVGSGGRAAGRADGRRGEPRGRRGRRAGAGVGSAPWLIVVGAVCIAGAWLYTGGSKPYGYLGLGEVAVFVFFGLVAVLGTQYVQASGSTGPAWCWRSRWDRCRRRCWSPTTCATSPPTESARSRSPCGSATLAPALLYQALLAVQRW